MTMSIFNPYRKTLTYFDTVGLDLSLLGFSILCVVIAFSNDIVLLSQLVIFIICATLSVETVIAVIDLLEILSSTFKYVFCKSSKMRVESEKSKDESNKTDTKRIQDG